MARPWSRVVVQDDPGVAEAIGGRIFQGLNVAMSDDDVRAIQQGYKCINCWENLDHAFPKECPLCSFPMKDHQAERFARVYAGWKPDLRTGPNWEKIADELELRAERRAFAKRAKESGIVVPRRI